MSCSDDPARPDAASRLRGVDMNVDVDVDR